MPISGMSVFPSGQVPPGWYMSYGGLFGTTTGKPVKPVKLPEEKTELPEDKRDFDCLIEYLNRKGYTEVPMPGWLVGEPEVVGGKLRLKLPFGSMNSLIVIKISTELADTIVWEPLVGNFKITDMPEIGDVGDRKLQTIKIKNEATISASGTVWLSVNPEDAPLTASPVSFGTGTLDSGEEKIYTYDILNLGTTEEVPFKVTAKVTNALGTITDSKTVSGKLLIKGIGETILTVYTIDDETKEYVSGITVTASWDSESKSGVTSGGSMTWSLGAAQPWVTVESSATSVYQSSSGSKQCNAGANSITLELLKIGVTLPWWQEYLWLIIAGVIIIAIAVSVAYVNKAKLKRRVKTI